MQSVTELSPSFISCVPDTNHASVAILLTIFLSHLTIAITQQLRNEISCMEAKSHNTYIKMTMLHIPCLRTVYFTVRKIVEKHPLARMNKDSPSTPLFIAHCVSNSHEGQLMAFSLWLNKRTVFLATRCWLIVQEDSFSLGGGGGTRSAAVPSLRVWKWRWQDVDEEARSVTSNRRALECSTLPAGNEPVRLLSAHLSPSHSLQTEFHPGEKEKHENAYRVFRIQY